MHPPVDDLASADTPLLVPQRGDPDALELSAVFAGLLSEPVAHQEVTEGGKAPAAAAAGGGWVGGGVGGRRAIGLAQPTQREVASDIAGIVPRAGRVE